MERLIERFLKREKKRKPKSFPTRKSHLKNFDAWLKQEDHTVDSLDGLTIEGFLYELRAEDYSPTYVAGHFDTLNHMFSMLVEPFKELEENPMKGLDRSDYTTDIPRKKEKADIIYLSKEQVELLCEHAPAPKLRNELLIKTMFVLGVRQGEAVAIRISDIDRESRSIRIKNLKRGPKQAAYRTVYWHDSDYEDLLTLWLDSARNMFSCANESPYLFLSEQAPKLADDRPNKVVLQAADAAGIQEDHYTDKNDQQRHTITSHALRHGHAVYALKNGVDVRSVQLQLGHAKLEQTMEYLELLDEDVRDAYRRWGARQSKNDAEATGSFPP